MTFECSEVQIQPVNLSLVRVTVENPNIEELLKDVDMEDIVSNVNIEYLLNEVGEKSVLEYVTENISAENILAKMDQDSILEFLGTKAEAHSNNSSAIQQVTQRLA